MKVGFNVECMTSLRYVLPIIERVIMLCDDGSLRDVDVCLVHTTHSVKYNGLGNPKNLSKYAEIVSRYAGKISVLHCDEVPELDCFFSIEGSGLPMGLQCKKHYALQHGIDYTNGFPVRCPEGTTYIMTDQLYADALQMMFPNVVNAVISPYPVAYWNASSFMTLQPDDRKSVTFFYPQSGYSTQAQQLIHALGATGYDVHVKQRRKAQPVAATGCSVTYDDVWYPSEAIVMPMMSTASAGFDTSAYVDIVPMGLPFVDVLAVDYNYPRPESELYAAVKLRDGFIDDVLSSLEYVVGMRRPIIPDEEVIRRFVTDLIVREVDDGCS